MSCSRGGGRSSGGRSNGGEKCRVEPREDLLYLAKGPSVCETKHLSYRGLRRGKGAEEGGLKRREGFFWWGADVGSPAKKSQGVSFVNFFHAIIIVLIC